MQRAHRHRTDKPAEDTTKPDVEESTEITSAPVIDPNGAASMGTYVFNSNATGGTFNVTDNNSTHGNITFSFRGIDSEGAKLRSDNKTTIKLSAETKVFIKYVKGDGVVMSNGTDTYEFNSTTDTHTLPAGTYTLQGASNSNSVIASMQLTATSSTTPEEPDDPSEPSQVLGDADGDGIVSLEDIQAIIDYAIGKLTNVTNGTMADVNGDGKVTAYDAFLIGKKLLN